MQYKATTVDGYLAELPPERQAALGRLRAEITKNLPPGFVEQMQWGMVGYVVPHSLYPAGYHTDRAQPLPFLALASQKAHIAVYHMGIYADPKLLAWFRSEHAKASPRKLDMGKSCIRYRKPEDIPFDLIGRLAGKVTPNQWIEGYERSLGGRTA
ncbi:MAG: DUF1801 domain-containing protein [Burkholderiaceae bacterium]|nr:DUF1801 domain-containing protein [Burkholderiaceae bacterium]